MNNNNTLEQEHEKLNQIVLLLNMYMNNLIDDDGLATAIYAVEPNIKILVSALVGTVKQVKDYLKNEMEK